MEGIVAEEKRRGPGRPRRDPGVRDPKRVHGTLEYQNKEDQEPKTDYLTFEQWRKAMGYPAMKLVRIMLEDWLAANADLLPEFRELSDGQRAFALFKARGAMHATMQGRLIERRQHPPRSKRQ